ncbi:MAG: trigger factor [Sedimentisphaerales bacterium]|nr:trigger factor [Sedimentisphaerales bacterium]
MTEMETNQEQEKKLDCTVNIEDSGPWKKKISVQIPREEINKELDNQYGELVQTAEVPGFRKGHAPRKLVEKRFGTEVTDQVKLRLLAQAFEQIEAEHKFDVLGEPDFDPDKVELPEDGDLTYEYEIEVRPEFETPVLEGIKIEKQLVEIDDERVNQALDNLRKRRGHMEQVEEAGDEDAVIADVEMKVNGINEPEKGNDVYIRVDQASVVMGVYVENMDEVLGGAKIGDVVNCSGEVPDHNQKEEFRGKKADFTITVKNISRLIPAEVNEEFLSGFGMDNEDELKRSIRDSLENQVDQEIRKQMAQQVYNYLEENIAFELPAGVAGRYSERVLARRYYDLIRQGVAPDQIEENMEKLRASSNEQAAKELKMTFIMDQVADKLEIEVSDMEVNGYIANMAAQQGRRPERVREELQRNNQLNLLENELREQKAIDKILEMAEVVDAPPVKEDKPAKKTRTKKDKKSTSKAETPDDDEKKTKTKKTRAKKEVKRKPPSADN